MIRFVVPLALSLTLVGVVVVAHGCVAAECADDGDCIDPDEPVCNAGTCEAGPGEGEGEAGEGEGEGEAGEGEGEGEGEGDGPCADKCECQAGQVCNAGTCTAPPQTCSNDDDCARGVQECINLTCNAASGQCEGEPEPCVVDADCASDQLCNQGFECTCNEGQCTPDFSCASNADCTNAPLTFCDPETSQCGLGTCQNGGVVCEEGQNCASNGECVNGSATDCANDDECVDPAEYCDLPAFGEDPGACTIGCRSNDGCGSPQVCNGAHQCVDDTGEFGDMCADIQESSDCGLGLTCGAISMTCTEQCTVPEAGPECTDGACCAVSGQPCCNVVFGEFAFCGECEAP
jgi:hypothetical protein